ncbi:MAG: gliding motility-associated C-terminal domain-containing protein [Saprospiraceae bacterium]
MKNSSLLRCLWRAFLLVPVAQSSQLLGQCPNIPAQVNVCEDDPVSISCTNCATLVWVGDDPNDISAAALGDAGDYTFSGTCPAGMGPATFNNRKVRLIVQDRPAVNNISDNAPICDGQTLQLGATGQIPGGSQWLWRDPNNVQVGSTQSITVPNAADGTYRVTVTGPGSLGCSTEAEVNITVNGLPNADISTDPPSGQVCQGENFSLAASGGNDYSWSGPNGLSNSGQTWDNLSQGGTYRVTVTDSNNCTSVAAQDFTVNPLPPLPTLTVSKQPACSNQDLTFFSTAGLDNSFAWEGPDGWFSDEQQPVRLNMPLDGDGEYTLIITNPNGCTNSANIYVTVVESPEMNIFPYPDPLCVGQDLYINTDGSPYSEIKDWAWQFPNGFDWDGGDPVLPNISLADAGEYALTVTSWNGCTDTDSKYVDVREGPQAVASANSTSPNIGSTLELSETGSNSGFDVAWLWRGPNGFTSASQNPVLTNLTPTASGLYLVIVTDDSGCPPDTAFIQISIPNSPGCTLADASVQPQNPPCFGQSTGMATVNFTGGQAPFSFVWKNGAGVTIGTTQSITGLSAGGYFVTVTDVGGCSVAATTNISQAPPIPPTNIFQTICAGQSLNFCGIDQNQPGIYTCNLTATGGCDSVVTLNLQVLPSIQTSISQTICAGKSVNFCGVDRDQSGIYTCNLTAAGGCDSVVTLNLQVLPQIQTSISQTICAGNSVNFCGVDRDQSGIFTCNLTAAGGCDSVVTLNLQVLPQIQTSISQTICAGQSINFCGIDRDQSGIFTCNLTATGGCDSVVTLNLQVLPSLQTSVSQTICAGNSVNFCGIDQDQSGVYSCNLTATGGCDSVVTLNLQVLPAPTASVFSETVCAGGCVVFGGLPRCTTGAFLDTLRSAAGCDSLYQILNLTVLPLPVSRDTVRICAGEATIFCGQKIYDAGTFDCIFQTPNGCDSLVQRTVEVRPRPVLAAADDAATLPPGVPELPINVSENDLPPADGTWFLTIVRQPVSGSVEQDTSGGLLLVRQDEQFSGPDSVLYALCSGICAEVCDSAWVLLFVQKSSLDDLENGIHNVITPGGSPGQNDVFDPVGYLLARDFAVDFAELSVFNRWGELLFFEKGDRPTWDGREAGGRIVPQATYYFSLQTETSTEKRVFKGPLTVLR